MSKYRFNPAELERLYLEEGLSLNEIAKRYGCFYTTVKYHLIKHGVRMRHRGAQMKSSGIRFDKLKPEEVGYLTGFFDGEGKITARITKEGHLSLVVGIENTNKEAMKYISGVFGKKVTVLKQRGRWKPLYKTFLSGVDAMDFLKVVLPFLKVKRKRAELFIRLVESKIRAKEGGRKELSQEELSIVKKIQRLNQRGSQGLESRTSKRLVGGSRA